MMECQNYMEQTRNMRRLVNRMIKYRWRKSDLPKFYAQATQFRELQNSIKTVRIPKKQCFKESSSENLYFVLQITPDMNPVADTIPTFSLRGRLRDYLGCI
eukprot:Pgem_evm1s13714